MARGQSETLRRFQDLAQAVLGVTERQERLMERQERCVEQVERLHTQVAGQVEAHQAAIETLEGFVKLLRLWRRPFGVTGLVLIAFAVGVVGGAVGQAAMMLVVLWGDR